MEGRTQRDPGFQPAVSNKPRGIFRPPINNKFPIGIYNLVWLDPSKYKDGEYIVCEEISPGSFIVRKWNTTETLCQFQNNSTSGKCSYRVSFLVAHEGDICFEKQNPSESIHARHVYVESTMQPNIFAGRNTDGEIGTIRKVKINGSPCYRIFIQETEYSEFEVICTTIPTN